MRWFERQRELLEHVAGSLEAITDWLTRIDDRERYLENKVDSVKTQLELQRWYQAQENARKERARRRRFRHSRNSHKGQPDMTGGFWWRKHT